MLGNPLPIMMYHTTALPTGLPGFTITASSGTSHHRPGNVAAREPLCALRPEPFFDGWRRISVATVEVAGDHGPCGQQHRQNEMHASPHLSPHKARTGKDMPLPHIPQPNRSPARVSQWLHAGLTSAGFEAVLLETRHVKAALSAMTVKTDRKDARGIAQLIRMGWFRAVHCKSAGSQALLVARKLLLSKLLNVEFSIRGILRGFGLKMGMVTRKRFEARVRELYAGHAMLEQICSAMLTARSALQTEYAKLHKALLVIVRKDEHQVLGSVH